MRVGEADNPGPAKSHDMPYGTRRRYGYRGVRVGEAKNPGPAKGRNTPYGHPHGSSFRVAGPPGRLRGPEDTGPPPDLPPTPPLPSFGSNDPLVALAGQRAQPASQSSTGVGQPAPPNPVGPLPAHQGSSQPSAQPGADQFWIALSKSRHLPTCTTCRQLIMQHEFRLRTSPSTQAKAHHLACLAPRIADWQTAQGLDKLDVLQRTNAQTIWAQTRRHVYAAHNEPMLDPIVQDQSDPRCGLDFFLQVTWADIHKGPSTNTTVPQRSLNAVGELLKNLLQQWRHHFDAGDHLQAECALKALCALPRLLLANKPRARNRAKTQQAEPEAGQTTPLHTKIAMAHEARWRELWKFHEHPDTAGISRPMSLKQQALETEACIAAGALGKALQCVKGKTPLARPSEAASALPGLFPAAAIPPWGPTDASLADDNTAFDEAVRRSLLRSPKRSGAGPDGMRYEHLRCLLIHDPANQDISYLLDHYLKGTLPPTVIAAFGSGTLVPLQKPGGRGIRPLVIGTVLHRIAARALCNTFAARMAEATAPNQFGSHRSAGGEKMHKIALALTTTKLDLCVLSIDLSNAFQCVRREALTAEVQRRLPALLPWLRVILGEASEITMHMPDTEPIRLQQTAGLRQGCPLSPLLFALASSPIVEELHSFTSADTRSGHTLAYVDDVTCLVKPEHVHDTLAAAADAARQMGLSINTRKCTVWCPPGAAARLPAGPNQLEQAPTPIVLGQFLEPGHLYFEAGPDGESQLDPNDVTCQSLLDKRKTFVTRLLGLTRQGLSKQAAHCLLRLFTASDTTWTARTMGLPAATAAHLDDILVAALNDLHNWSNFNAHMAQRAFMPVAEGGLGFASCAATRAGAIASSWALCLPDVLTATGHADLLELAFYARPLGPALNLTLDLHNEILGTTGAVALPLPASQAVKQRAFTQHATKRIIEEWEAHPETTPQLAAWRQSAGGTHAGAWLQFPSQPSHFMPDEIFDLSVRIRMADDILRPGPCPLRGANGTPCPGFCDAKGHHAMCCTYGAGAVKRHEAVANTLHKLLHNWGHTPIHRERLVPTDHDNPKRADIIYTDSENRTRPIDVMIVGPTSAQALAMGAARKRGTAANSGEN